MRNLKIHARIMASVRARGLECCTSLSYPHHAAYHLVLLGFSTCCTMLLHRQAADSHPRFGIAHVIVSHRDSLALSISKSGLANSMLSKRSN